MAGWAGRAHPALWSVCVVEVLHEDRWLSGRLLHAYRREDGPRRGVVRYTAGLGEQYEQARDRDKVRTVSRGTFRSAPSVLMDAVWERKRPPWLAGRASARGRV